jgi:hypothetical protein
MSKENGVLRKVVQQMLSELDIGVNIPLEMLQCSV